MWSEGMLGLSMDVLPAVVVRGSSGPSREGGQILHDKSTPTSYIPEPLTKGGKPSPVHPLWATFRFPFQPSS